MRGRAISFSSLWFRAGNHKSLSKSKGGQKPRQQPKPTSSSCMISSIISVGLLLYFVAALMASRNNCSRQKQVYNRITDQIIHNT